MECAGRAKRRRRFGSSESACSIRSPSPQPSPQGEGESSSCSEQFAAFRSFVALANGSPSPWGEGWGEGERACERTVRSENACKEQSLCRRSPLVLRETQTPPFRVYGCLASDAA